MGIIQDKVIQQMGEQMQDKMTEMLDKANKMNEETVKLLTSVLEVLKEIQLCTNNNFVWTMNSIQAICDRTGVVLDDPLEK
jgi:hypothetical protein